VSVSVSVAVSEFAVTAVRIRERKPTRDRPFVPIEWIDLKKRVEHVPIPSNVRPEDACFRVRRVGYVSVFNLVLEECLTPRPSVDLVRELQTLLRERSATKSRALLARHSDHPTYRRIYERHAPLREAFCRTGRVLIGGVSVEFWRREDWATALLREAIHAATMFGGRWCGVSAPCTLLSVGVDAERPDVLAPLSPDFYDARLRRMFYVRYAGLGIVRGLPFTVHAHWVPVPIDVAVASADADTDTAGAFEFVRNHHLQCIVLRARPDPETAHAPLLPTGRRNLPRRAAVYVELLRALARAHKFDPDDLFGTAPWDLGRLSVVAAPGSGCDDAPAPPTICRRSWTARTPVAIR
jgi:hypothetical protein